ncbi:heparinase II/III family protein [Asticcacaulis sp. AC402]|uniref:heparinase II/III family protein n=1 Tax=Asticcacaulis sp. AC402 TaxID=1282361 RepID=UPI0003C3D646|nr:heparinase II/III family protein [Asticcacaulis sp. AC402]ESQ75783.1 heparinase [Asticcacaulis sp. AC402]
MQAFEPGATEQLPPVKTPWAKVIGILLRKQIGAELFGMPGYRLTLKGRTPDGFLAAPHDGRPSQHLLGKAILSGRFLLCNARMSVQGSGDPWNRPSPTRAFGVELHRFSWLSSLLAHGDEGTRESVRLFILWHKIFRNWTPFTWGEEVLPRRLINLSLFARRMASLAAPDEVHLLAQSMAEQGRHLLRLSQQTPWAGQQSVALVLLGCVLSGRVGDGFRKKGLSRLPKVLKKIVLPDGSHASRSPEQGLDLLYDLLLVEDALSQRGMAVPDYLDHYIDRLMRFVRTCSHPDGSLCAFQGSESILEDQVVPALVRTGQKAVAAIPNVLEHGRYHRMTGRSLTVYVDAGESKTGVMGYAACDHPMAFEVSGGRDKLIVQPGWSPSQSDQQAFRIIGAGNTLTLSDRAVLSPVSGRFGEMLNFGLEGPRYKLRSRRVEAEDSGSLLEMEHEGWRDAFGLKHERRLYVDAQRDELRGEERLTPMETKQKDLPVESAFTVRFLLHPEVQASLARDRKSVLLRGPGGRGWWLRHDARDVTLETGWVFERGAARKSVLIALRGTARLETSTRVRWKLSPAEG